MGKKTSKTTSTSSPPSWAVQPLQTGMSDLLNTYTQNQGNLQNLESGLTGTIGQLGSQIGQTQKQLQPGENYISSSLSPGFLQNGQSQAQVLGNFAGQQAGNQINSAFSAAGRTGSGNNVTDTARGVTQAELAPMLQNLQYNEGIQSQNASLLPSYTNASYTGYTPLLAANQLAGQLPYYGSPTIGAMGSLVGNYGTQTGTQPGGWGSGLLGAASNMFSFAPISLSDRRLKTHIEKVGEASDGLGIYEWNWKADPNGEKIRGVIADEVEKLRPWAFVPNFVGQYAGVNYAALGGLE